MTPRYEATITNETNWVRSSYLYGVLFASGAAAVVGVVLAAMSVVTIVNPQSGMSGWERVFVGVPTVLDEGLDLAEEYLTGQRQLPRYCTDDLAEDDPDYEWCERIRDELAQPLIPEEADEAVGLIRDETLRQIRHGSIGRLVVGVVVSLAAVLVFRRHARLSVLYADRGPAPEPTAITASTPPPPPV